MWLLYIRHWIMKFLQKHLDHYDITRPGPDGVRLYMRRFFLIHQKKGWIRNAGWLRWLPTIFLHYIARGDEDKWMHDHPWAFVAIPLSGCYVEEDDTGFRKKWPLIPRYRSATYRHRLHLTKPVWTIFIHFKRERDWGFWTDTGWVLWTDYIPPEQRAYHSETIILEKLP